MRIKMWTQLNRLFKLLIVSSFILLFIYLDEKITFDFMNYEIEISASLLLFIFFFSYFVLRFFEKLLSYPRHIFKIIKEKSRINNLHNIITTYENLISHNFDKAEKFAKKVKHNKDAPENFSNINLLLQAKQRNNEANFINSAHHLINCKSTENLGLKELAIHNFQQNNYDKAIELALKAKKNSPKVKWVNEFLYEAYLANQMFEEAVDILKFAKKHKLIEPTLFQKQICECYYNYAKNEKMNNKPLKAIKLLEKLKDINIYDFNATIFQSQIFLELKQYSKAKKVIEKQWKSTPTKEFAERIFTILETSNLNLQLENLEHFRNNS